MKKNIFLLIALVAIFSPANIHAQAAGDPVKVWTDPVIFTYDQPVTWYFDMTGSPFTAGMDLYLWTWAPSEPDAGNGGNSSEFAKLDYVGNMVWKKTLTPTLYYGLTVEQITSHVDEFWMNLKDKHGTISTNTIHVVRSTEDINDFTNSGAAAEIYPKNFSLKQPVSILVNLNKVWTGDIQGGLVGSPSVYFNSGLNGFQQGASVYVNMSDPSIVTKTKFKDLGNNIYKFDLIPNQYFGVADTFPMQDISFDILSPDGSTIGIDAGKKYFVFKTVGAPIPPDPILYFFPKKFSQKDIFSVVRRYNETNATKLKYAITAGNITLTGDFKGTKDDLEAHINLTKELAGSPNLDKIHLIVTDNNGLNLLDTDISLVQLSELE